MYDPELEDLFLRLKATAHAIDTMISHDGDAASEDVSVLSMMLVELVDEYDKKRK